MSYLDRVGVAHAKQMLVRAGIAKDFWQLRSEAESAFLVELLDGSVYRLDKLESERLAAVPDGVAFVDVMSEVVVSSGVPERVIRNLYYDLGVQVYSFRVEPENEAIVIQLDMSYEFHPLVRFEGVNGVNWYDPADVLRAVSERTSKGFAFSGAIDHLWARVEGLNPSNPRRADLEFYYYMTERVSKRWKCEISRFTFTTEDAVQVLVALYGMIDQLMAKFRPYIDRWL